MKSFRCLRILLPLVLFILLCRYTLIVSYSINTESMLPTIIPSNVIYVSKLIFGIRIVSPIHGKLYRIFGIRKIKCNDIIVFNYPLNKAWNKIYFNKKEIYVKRCIGMPGDTLRIENGYYKVGNKTLGNIENQFLLSKMAKDKLVKKIDVNFLKIDKINWNIINWGPYYIPRKGDSIELNINNYNLYALYINYESGKELIINDSDIFMGEHKITTYTFKSNYYFVAGDNVINSFDSRYFGLVPEDFIIGIALK